MGKIMQRVNAMCGDRPQLGKLAKNTSGEILAGALIDANPGRFQTVSPSGYIPGIDY